MTQMRLPDVDTTTVAQGRLTFHNLRASGRGGFGQVYRASVAGDDGFALKRQRMRLDSKGRNEYLKNQMRELRGLRREAKIYSSATLNSGQTVHLALLSDIAFVTHNYADGTVIEEPLLAMQWANAHPHNTLQAWMRANPVSEHNIRERLSFTIQMFSGLVELHYGHEQKTSATPLEESIPLFVHQDLKPANMLLFGDSSSGSGPLRLALTDFGLSICYNGADAEAECGGGTLFFKAPEQWSGLRARTPDRDIWAAGMVVAKLFAGPSLLKMLSEYQIFCEHVHAQQHHSPKITEEFCDRAKNFVPAITKDALLAPASQLSRVQQAIAQLLLKCFRIGRELGGVMLAGNARPTSRKCEEFSKTIWQKTLGFESWRSYHNRLPRPKPTALQNYSPHDLANFYFENMEMGMLTMMLRQCERLFERVAYSDKRFVEMQIESLKKELEQTEVKAKSHRRKASQESFTAANNRQVNLDAPTHDNYNNAQKTVFIIPCNLTSS